MFNVKRLSTKKLFEGWCNWHPQLNVVASVKTAWKMSKYGEFSLVRISRIRTEYGVSLRIHSEYRKIRTRKTPHLDSFNAVEDFQIWKNILHPSTKKQYGGSRLLLLILISLFQIPLFVLQFGLFFRNIVFPELVTWQ